jgi:hypothetical protein
VITLVFALLGGLLVGLYAGIGIGWILQTTLYCLYESEEMSSISSNRTADSGGFVLLSFISNPLQSAQSPIACSTAQ